MLLNNSKIKTDFKEKEKEREKLALSMFVMLRWFKTNNLIPIK